jgi:hypothetical protein
MDHLNADILRVRVGDHFRDHGSDYGLDPATLSVEYVLNWGGFVNYSYRLRDARRSYHLKLATSPDYLAGLRRWRALSPLLEPYHAPAIVDWIDLGTAAGLLFEFVSGDRPALNDQVLAELLPVLNALNADEALAAALQPTGVITGVDVYMTSFHERFTEDLKGIREAPPPFIPEALLRLLEEEVEYLAVAIAAAPAFAEPLKSPVHADLWLNNILWLRRDSWHLLDWDDVRIGDPAVDVATLLGPTAEDLTPLKMIDRVEHALAPSTRERLPLLGRVTLLDWVIDPVSDWIDAEKAPGLEDLVRPEKERVHRAALRAYEQRYG